jgi:hypothetical protein
VECYEECIVEFRVIMDPASRGSREHRKFKPAQLSLKGLDGSLHILSRETTEQAVMALFGRPDESGPVGEDRVHTFILGGNFIDTYHSPVSGRLMELTLSLAAEDATIS